MASVGAVALAGSALAADLPSRAPPPVYLPPAPIFTWTGIYLGGQIGYAWTNYNTAVYANGYCATCVFVGQEGGIPGYIYDSFPIGGNASGVIGGAHVGYNLQFNQWVVGLEGDVDGSSLSKTVNLSPYSNYYLDYIPTTVHTTLGVQGSIRGRVGIAFDRVLLYGTGGVAFGGFKSDVTTAYGGGLFYFNSVYGHDSFSQTRVGWTAGGGIEYAVTNNWSVRAEYRYTDFGRTHNYLVNAYPTFGGDYLTGTVNRHLVENRVQVGFSYKFDTYHPAPVVAKY
jgi:outer membrane immunogenic protein